MSRLLLLSFQKKSIIDFDFSDDIIKVGGVESPQPSDGNLGEKIDGEETESSGAVEEVDSTVKTEDSSDAGAEQAQPGTGSEDTAEKKSGWKGKKYYKNGKYVTGSNKIGKYTYFFDKKGNLVKNQIVTEGKKAFYVDAKGIKVTDKTMRISPCLLCKGLGI